MEQSVSASLCGLPLAKASIAIGVLHAVLFGGCFFYEMAEAFYEWLIVLNPPGLFILFIMNATYDMFNSEALLNSVASVCLVIGAWKSVPGLVLTWLIQQAVLILSSLLTLIYFVAASFLKTPLLNILFELALNGLLILACYRVLEAEGDREMERVVITDVFGLPLADCSILIGVIDAIIYGGLFIWEYSTRIEENMVLVPIQSYMFVLNLMMDIVPNIGSLMSCVVSAVMVAGILKHRAGFVLTWAINQVTAILSSFLTLLFFIAAAYYKIPLRDCFYSLLINGYQFGSLIIVYSFYHHLRRGNLRN